VPTLLKDRDVVDTQDWGWSVDSAFPDENVIRFDRVKLYLSEDSQASNEGLDITKGMAEPPEGVTPRMMIAEYFNAIRKHIEVMISKHIQSNINQE
jgi:hypothetical protein